MKGKRKKKNTIVQFELSIIKQAYEDKKKISSRKLKKLKIEVNEKQEDICER